MTDINSGWSVNDALSVLHVAPRGPADDTTHAPDYNTVKSAREFLESRYSNEDIRRMLEWSFDKDVGRPLREF